nr:MAG TPA: hypothetical protein [Caudoviricetes sp.]
MSKWNGKKFSVYTSDEKSALGLIKELGEQTNYNTDELEQVKISDSKKVSHQEMQDTYKIDKNANFTGSWFGIKKPTASQEGLQATVDKIVEEDIPNINSQLDNIALQIKTNNLDDSDELLRLESLLPENGGVILIQDKIILKKKINFTKSVVLISKNAKFDGGNTIELYGEGSLYFNGDSSGAYDITILGKNGHIENGIVFQCGWAHGKNINVVGCGKNGIIFGSEIEERNYNGFKFENIHSRDNQIDGIVITHPNSVRADANTSVYNGLYAYNNKRKNILLKNASSNTIINPTVHSGGHGIVFENSDSNVIINAYIETLLETSNYISFDDTSDENKIFGTSYGMWSYDKVVDSGQRNILFTKDQAKHLKNQLMGNMYFDEMGVSNSKAGGYWSFIQDNNRDLIISYDGYTGNANVDLRGKNGKNTFKIDKLKIGNDIVSLSNILYAISPINFDNCVGNYVTAKNMSVQGAKVGDFVQIATDKVHENVVFSAMVISENIVSVRVANISSSQVDLGDVVCKVMVSRME